MEVLQKGPKVGVGERIRCLRPLVGAPTNSVIALCFFLFRAKNTLWEIVSSHLLVIVDRNRRSQGIARSWCTKDPIPRGNTLGGQSSTYSHSGISRSKSISQHLADSQLDLVKISAKLSPN